MAEITTQPTPTKEMDIPPSGGNRNAKNLPMQDGERDWSFGLLDCSGDAGTCVMACCCPCVVYGQVKQRYEHLQSKGSPHPEHGGCVNGDCMVSACVIYIGFGWIMQMMNRGSIRTRYNIRGGGLGDCCAAFCCTPCELTQESRELELEEKSFQAH